MNKFLLLHERFRLPGWLLIIIGIAGFIAYSNGWEPAWLNVPTYGFSDGLKGGEVSISSENNLTDEIISLLIIAGCWFAGFARVKDEDEMSGKLRLTALSWALVLNYSILVLAILFTFELSFLQLIIYNIFTPLILFVIILHALFQRYKIAII